MTVDVRLLHSSDAHVLERVAPEVFDHAVHPRWSQEFFDDARHHLFVAVEDGVVVGMATGVHYVHPDKAPQLWINEIGVAPSHQKQGIGRCLLDALLAHGQALGCTEAWLGTEETNVAARRLYESVGGEAEPFILYSFPLVPADGGSP